MKKSILLSSVILAGSLVSAFAFAADNNNQFNPEQVNSIQNIVHDYLVKNPQVLIEASEALQQQEMAKVEEKAQGAIVSNAKDIFNNSNSPVAGNPKGDITLVEFFDYQCPHCKDMAAIVDKLMENDKNLRVVFKELPIFGGNSQQASLAALAAYKQGAEKYLKFHNALMSAANPLTPNKIMQIAKDSGLNTDKLKKNMDDAVLKDQIKDNFKLAQELGIMGTPSFVLGTQQAEKAGNSIFIPGATTEANLQQNIDKLRKS